ncbi:MAG: cyclic nucleotide-binding domain-containing protein [Puniceicoccaceae bacterium]
MKEGELGKVYQDGELVVRQGEVGNCMYVIQAGEVEIFREEDGRDIRLRVAGPNEFFGEMALVENDVRSASVRSLGESRILHVDKRTFMRRVHEDPSLAYRIMESLSHEIRRLAAELGELKAESS